MNIIETIDSCYGSMTRKQKLIADYMRSHTEDMRFMTLKALSEAVEVSEMTILKLCGVLGCGSYNALKQAFRDLTPHLQGGERYTDKKMRGFPAMEWMGDSSGLFGQICMEELEGVHEFLRAFSIEEYRKAARMICQSRGVVLLGSGVSVQMAGYLYSRLVECGVACLIVDARREEDVRSALHMMGSDTVVMPLFFPEYPPLIPRIVRYAQEKGAGLLGITDSTRAEITALCDMCLYCPCYNHLFSDSQTTAVLAANLLAMAVSLEQDRTGDSTRAAVAVNRVFEGT